MGRLAVAAGRSTVVLDGREVDPSPQAVEAVLGDRLTVGSVLLVDSYENLAPVDGWFRTQLLPSLRPTR
jgi:hypothetical protein